MTPLVSVFRFDRDMLPFVRYLLNEHGVFSVRDWDAAPLSVFDGFGLADELRARFKQRIGRPRRSFATDSAKIRTLRAGRQPA
ncbi:hypothetical protein [Bradyrhizobium ivorense]|uniref:hypothetical protein n=1 Tax=Bradyrhizobium ivorense TaxID=2511166 RepID=UPI00111655A3|nr:hypothetical protein [Bradyrhizobium ivorense]